MPYPVEGLGHKIPREKTILIVDDVDTNVSTLIELLGDNYDMLATLSAQGALEILEEEQVDLILLDILMPDMNGLDLCRQIKSRESTKDIPIIFITVKTDEDSIEDAYAAGGVDYITKPFKSREVLSRIKKELDLQEMMRELAFLASTDPLTNLHNRRHFAQIAQQVLAIAKRQKETPSLIMMDIDHFKQINDTYGHKAGDDVIVHLAKTVMKHLRESDFACRFGGEEFVALLPNTSLSDARLAAEKLRKAVEASMVVLEDGSVVQYTVSLGVSAVNVMTETTIEIALKRADDALYEAKESGRNLVR